MQCTLIDASPGGYFDNISSSVIVSRDIRKCVECNGVISAGDSYFFEVGEVEGDIYKFRTCMDCISVREELFDDFTYEKIWEDLDDFIFDCSCEIPESRLSRLTIKAREKVCGMIEECWDNLEDEEI